MSLVTLWAIATITFFMMHAVPGDPFSDPKLPPAIHANMLRTYGLDRPLGEQYVLFLNNLLHGNFGTSLRTGRPVGETIANGLPNSMILGLEALVFAVVIGIALGIIAALNRNKPLDYLAVIVAIIGVSVPSFVVAALFQYFFGVYLQILPVAGWKGWEFHILPAFALGLSMLAVITRLMRSQMLEVINQDYIRTARAKGLSRGELVWRHEIRNAILPVITILGPLTAAILTGTFVIETMFNIPGLGRYFVTSISNRDYSMIGGTTVFYSMILILANFVVDTLYGVIDPRIRVSGGRE